MSLLGLSDAPGKLFGARWVQKESVKPERMHCNASCEESRARQGK